MNETVKLIGDLLPLLLTIVMLVAAACEKDDLKEIKYLLWAILLYFSPMIDLVV